jgi:hypothetical protein
MRFIEEFLKYLTYAIQFIILLPIFIVVVLILLMIVGLV